jgi:hypothetical protein
MKILFPSVAIVGYLQSPAMDIKALLSDRHRAEMVKIKKQVLITIRNLIINLRKGS